MAGHNKWAQIKRKKAVVDAKRSKIFSLLAKTITIEAGRCRGDRTDPGLRTAINRAKDANMPNDNIERAIGRGLIGGGDNYEEVLYEAYGPGGTALIIEGVTNNKNRTTAEIKHLLTKHGGHLSSQGSVLWAFLKEGDNWSAKHWLKLNPNDQEKLFYLLKQLTEHDDIKTVIHNVNL